MPESFSPEEVAALVQHLLADEDILCPRCDLRLDRRPIPPRRDVSYVRRREWVGCPSCHRNAVLDRSEGR
jgi:hypothetical protein